MGQPIGVGMRQAIATLVICLILFGGMVVLLFSGQVHAPQVSSSETISDSILEPAKPVRDVTPEDVVQPPTLEAPMLERLPAVKPPPLPKKPPKPVTWSRPQILSAGLIRSGENTVRLAGIEQLETERTCQYDNGGNWPCGRIAKASLARFVRTRTLECDPVDTTDALVITTHCRIGGKDLSAWLVRYGWAVPKDELFPEELERARAERLGIWRTQKP